MRANCYEIDAQGRTVRAELAEAIVRWRDTNRSFWIDVEHAEAGKRRYAGWPYQMSATPPQVGRSAPLLGQHNETVYGELLGMSAGEVAELQMAGVL